MSPIKFSLKSSETLNKLTNLVKGDRRDLALKDKIKHLVKISEILERLKSLLINCKRVLVSVSPILILLRLRQTL